MLPCLSPAAPTPNPAVGYTDPLSVRMAFFMYAENSRICIDFHTRAETGVQQVKIQNVIDPTDTVFLAEQDPNSPTVMGSPAMSVVTAYYAIARHDYNRRGEFAMCDGSARSATTNEFWESQGVADNSTEEWKLGRPFHWYPTPTTPN